MPAAHKQFRDSLAKWKANGVAVLPGKVTSRIGPKHTGYEPRLYSLEGYLEEQQQAIEEHFFAVGVDGPASQALKVLIAGDLTKLTDELGVAWTRFLMAARAR